MTVWREAMAVAIAALLLISGCGHKKTVRRLPAPVPRPGDTETGLASWYGYPYHGRRAANGEIYDMEQMTAAHRTLPFDTWVRVENLSNRKQVEVRITDRGPFIEGRIIDLSHAAARQIDLVGPGTAMVRLLVIARPVQPAPTVSAAVPQPPPPPAPVPADAPRFAVQVGAFRDRANAERVRAEMEARYGTARLVERPGDTALWRVLVGSLESESAAQELADRIRREANDGTTGFVVRL